MRRLEQKIRKKPESVTVQAFGVAILFGTILLMLPWASRLNKWTDPLTALFTATSATCVTGLTIVDTGAYFSRFGQLVILALIQAGGLGIMTLGTFLLVVVGRQLSMNEEIVLMDALGTERSYGLKSVIVRAVLLTVCIELAGTLILAARLASRQSLPWPQAVYVGLFHSVSALCNAGFALQADSLVGWRKDPVLILTILVLVVVGGLGFLVWHNLISLRPWRRDRTRRSRLSLHTQVVLRATGILILVGGVLFVLFEWEKTLHGAPWAEKVLAALFQSVPPRTGGFAVVDLSQATPAALYVTMALMFVGGSPCSMAGGIKTSTLAVLVLVAASLFRGRQEVEAGSRKISDRVVREALAVFMLGLLCVSLVFLALLTTEHSAFGAGRWTSGEPLLFETVSAFATVGLSTGITAQLSVPGKLCIILLMVMGRVGPLTVALMIGRKDVQQRIHFPEEEVLVG